MLQDAAQADQLKALISDESVHGSASDLQPVNFARQLGSCRAGLHTEQALEACLLEMCKEMPHARTDVENASVA
ncbi:hypothetical protein D3C81_2061260 [compost metagenome]